MSVDFARAEVVPELPASVPSGRGKSFPPELVGAEIVAIGTLPDASAAEGGGLVIDYRKSGCGVVSRLVLGFTELGMWVEYCGRR